MSVPGHNPEAIAVVGNAQLEAKRLSYPFIQREQLFLGLLQDPTIARIFELLEADLQSTRSGVEERTLPGLGAPDNPTAIGLLPTADKVFEQQAKTAAALLGHTHIGPEHILLGFLLEQHGTVQEVLTAHGVTKDKVMNAIKRLDMRRGSS